MRTFDSTILNEIANRPDVRPHLMGQGPLDLSQLIGNPANVTYAGPQGGFIAVQISDVLYEVHTIFTPDRDGAQDVIKIGQDALAYMFTHTGCLQIITRVPEPNRGAHMVASRVGFKDFAMQKDIAPGVDAKLMRLTVEDWTLRAIQPRVEGFAFHGLLHEAKMAMGSTEPPHAEDEKHDRFVGACLLMAKAGQIGKAFQNYNHAAFIYGYQPIRLLSQIPAIVDTGDAIVGIENGQIEVMLCR